MESAEILDVPNVVIEQVVSLLASNLLIVEHECALLGRLFVAKFHPSFCVFRLPVSPTFYSVSLSLLFLPLEIDSFDAVKLGFKQFAKTCRVHEWRKSGKVHNSFFYWFRCVFD